MSAITSEGWVRVRANDPCPRCDRRSYCLYHPGRNIGVCTRSESPHYWAGMNGWAYRLSGGDLGRDWRDALRDLPPPAPKPTHDPDLLDRAYRAMLAALPLSPAHRAALVARGMSHAEIEAGGYGSLPDDERVRSAALAAVAAAIGGNPLGVVPGVARRPNGSVGIFAAAGMLVPVRDLTGQTRGLRVRVDDPDKAASGKYRHLSGGEGGASIDGSTLHVALPLGGIGGRVGTVVVVEGEIKASFVANRMRLPVLGLAGVDCIGQVVDHLRLLDEGGGIEVAVAYDADKRDNPDVARAEHRLVAALRRAGYRAVEWAWDGADAKGLDDLLALGYMPHPSLYPDDLPLADAPPSEATQRQLREAREQRDAAYLHARRVTQMLGNRNLGGDLAPTVAVLTYADLKARIADNPAPDGRYELKVSGIVGGEQNEKGNIVNGRVSPGTVKKTWETWAETGLLPIEVDEEPYKLPGGADGSRKVYTVVVPDNDIEAIAASLVTGHARERSKRGGARRCLTCGGTQFKKTVRHTCTGCGSVEESTAVTVDYGRDEADEAHPQTLQAAPDPDDAGDPWGDDREDVDRPQTLRAVPPVPDDPVECPSPEYVLYRQSLQAADPDERVARARADLLRRRAGVPTAGENDLTKPHADPPPEPASLPGFGAPGFDRWTG
jgi:hypothetical protein